MSPADVGLEGLDGVIQPAVRTSGAEHRRARGDLARIGAVFVCGSQNGLAHHRLREFAAQREERFPFERQPQLPAVRLNDVVQLFDDDQPPDLRGERLERVDRQRVDHPQLEVGDAVAQRLARVHIRRTRADDADAFVVVLDAVDAARLRPRAQRFGARLHVDVARLRHRGHHHVLGHVADIRQVFARLPLACNDDRARVRNAGGEPRSTGVSNRSLSS